MSTTYLIHLLCLYIPVILPTPPRLNTHSHLSLWTIAWIICYLALLILSFSLLSCSFILLFLIHRPPPHPSSSFSMYTLPLCLINYPPLYQLSSSSIVLLLCLHSNPLSTPCPSVSSPQPAKTLPTPRSRLPSSLKTILTTRRWHGAPG